MGRYRNHFFNSLCVIIHNDRHGIDRQTVCFGHHTFTEAICHVISTQKRRSHYADMKRDEPKHNDVPAFKGRTLEFEKWTLAPRKD